MQSITRLCTVLILFQIRNVQGLWSEFEWVDITNSNAGVLETDLKVTRYNRTIHTLSGELNWAGDLTAFNCELKVYYSSKGNNQFILSPFRIPATSCCEFFDSNYWKIMEKDLILASDMPERQKGVKACLTYKGKYTVKQYALDKNLFTRFLEPGSYKGEFYFYEMKSGTLSVMVGAIARFY